MGLDMYLSARRYVSGWESTFASSEKAAQDGRKEVELFDSILDTFGLDREDITVELPSATVSIEVAYWRKANAIHNWFIENVAGGVDNCEPVRVDREQLNTLVRTLGDVLGLRHSGEESGISIEDLLPTQDGFFFGSTEYNDYFWENVQWTYDKLVSITDSPKFDGFDFVYQASW